MMEEKEKFEGYAERECGKHRTAGIRAWCYECTEWCYESAPCKGCEVARLQAENRRLRSAFDDAQAVIYDLQASR